LAWVSASAGGLIKNAVLAGLSFAIARDKDAAIVRQEDLRRAWCATLPRRV
jgi:hypothetical protein